MPLIAKRIGIEKIADSFTLFVSVDGVPMHEFGQPIQPHLDGPSYVGIGLASHHPDKTDTAGSSNVRSYFPGAHADRTDELTVVNRRANLLAIQFAPDPWIRPAPIRKLFTGSYHQDLEKICAFSGLATLGRIAGRAIRRWP